MEGLERILAELHHIAFWVVTVANTRALELPLSLRRIELTTERLCCGARNGDADNWERLLDSSVLARLRRFGDVN